MKSIFFSLFLLTCLVFTGCDNGSGVVVKKDCTLPWGGLLEHGASVTAYKEAVSTVGCESEQRTCNDGSLSGSFSHKACAVQGGGDDEPSTHEKPMRINDKDLKVGGVKLMGSVSTYQSSEYSDMFSPKPKLEDIAQCSPSVVIGGACASGTPICKNGTKIFTCETKTTYKVFGWVYEEIGRDYKAAEGVKADIFWFAGCISGMCNSLSGPVKTDKWGYFELLTTALLDTVRLDGLEVGLYAFCKDGKPIAGGGSAITGLAGKPFSDAFAHQKRIKPDSCK